MSQPAKKRKGRKLEVVFDPEARKAHLRGFAERKRQRRAYGLAMQKVKDRKAKIEQRKQERKNELERVEEAEKQKEVLLEEHLNNAGVLKDDPQRDNDTDVNKRETKKDSEDENKAAAISEKQYGDEQIELKWGGRVTVTTSFVSLDELTDEEDLRDIGRSMKSVDKEQKSAGDVSKYLDELKGNMPSRKKQGRHTMKKGKNGASDMRGMGGSSNLKVAQKVLGKAKAKSRSGTASCRKGNTTKKLRR
eukprot:scaffold3084_cov144-Cylindrotheca_fusiformis.AAC.36